MSDRYFVKIKGKVSGPFDKQKVIQFIEKGKLNASVQAKVDGSNSWASLSTYSDFTEIFSSKNEESTSFIKLDQLNEIKNQASQDKQGPTEETRTMMASEAISNKNDEEKDDSFQEFKFGKDAQEEVDYNKIEKEYEENKSNNPADVDPTKINRPQKIVNINETLVVNPPVEEKEEVEEEPIEEIVDEKTVVQPDDETRLLQDVSYDVDLVRQEKESEKEILEEIKKHKEEIKADEVVEEEVDEEEEESKIKKMKPITLLAFVVIFAYIFLDEEKKEEPVNPKFFTLTTIYANPYVNQAESERLYEKAVDSYNKATYPSKVLATKFLKESLAHQTDNRLALGLLVLTYSEIIENVKNRRTAKHNFNVLLQISETQLLKDPNIAIGAALYYSYYGKHSSAVRVLKDFLRATKLKKGVVANVKLYSAYLRVLLKAGKLEEAAEFYKILKNLKFEQKSLDVYYSLSQYDKLNENLEEREKNLLAGLERYPSSVQLLLELSDNYYQLDKYKQLEKVLDRVEKLRAEESPVYYAKFLEYLGLVAALKGQNKKAVSFFRLSMAMINNETLRSRLASLEAGGTDAENKLILESKAVKLMEEARKEMKALRWEKAFIHAIDAVDTLPTFVPAQLLLAEIQTRRGYFERALDSLKKLQAEDPTNINVNISLIDAYINARRYDDAQSHLTMLSREKTINFQKMAEFSSLQGRLFFTKGNIPQAIDHLNKAVALDPLNDKDFALLAEIFLKYRKYSRSKSVLLDAIKLEPHNVNYRALYAKILYELDSAQTAIGYLKKFDQQLTGKAKILGEIATYHYLNGDNKEFERYKEMVEKLEYKDKSFYEFMIKASKLEKKVEDIIKYAQDLIKVEPGDLPTRMLLGEYLYKEKRYSDAEEIFTGIKERLSAYPRTHYFLGKIYIALKRYEDALVMGKKEIELNPEITDGYFISGLAHKYMQEFPEAINMLERAISKDGKNVEALMTLGEIRYAQNFLDSARELYLRAKRHSPSTAHIYKQLGYIYRRMGQSGLAVENFQVYLNRSPLADDRDQIQNLINSLK